MPLFHSLACSLQLKVHSETWGGTKMHTCSDECEHTPIPSLRLKAAPPCLFIQRCDILPWHVIKKCHRFWRSDFHCLQMSRRGQKQPRLQNDELVLDHACKLNSSGMGRGVRELPPVAWWKQPGVSTVSLGLAKGSLTSPPWDARGKHSVPPSGSEYPFVPTQSILAQFLFLSLALFLHLPCQRWGDRGTQRGQWFRQPGKRSSSFPRPSTPSELLTFAPLH